MAGSALTAAELNEQVRDNEDWLKEALSDHGITSTSALGQIKSALAGVRAYRSTTRNVNDSTEASIEFTDADIFDSNAFHSIASNEERITIPTGFDGYYLVGGGAHFASNSTGYRTVFIEKNGVDGGGTEVNGARQRVPAVNGTATNLNVVGFVDMAASDYFAMTVLQTSGGVLAVSSASFWALRVFAA